MNGLYLIGCEYLMVNHVKIHDGIDVVNSFIAKNAPVSVIYSHTYKILRVIRADALEGR